MKFEQLFADDKPDRVTRYSVIVFVCLVIVAGAWSIALAGANKLAPWQWDTLGILTGIVAVVFFRWFRFARTTVAGLASVASAIALMLLITF